MSINEPTESTGTGTSPVALAEHLEAIAAKLRTLGDVEIAPTWIGVDLQVLEHGGRPWEQRKAAVELLGCAFGAEAVEDAGRGWIEARPFFGLKAYGHEPSVAEQPQLETAPVESEPEPDDDEDPTPAGITIVESSKRMEARTADGTMVGTAERTSARNDDEVHGWRINVGDTLAVAYTRLATRNLLALIAGAAVEAAPLPVTVADAYTSLERAVQQLRTSQTGEQFTAGFGSFMDALAAAAEAEDESERAA